MRDLWPSFPTSGPKAPVTILREQASFLGQQTGNLVEAEVGGAQVIGLDGAQVLGGRFFYDFVIVAPALGRYRYRLFQIAHDIRLYPVEIYPDEDILREILPISTKRTEADDLLAALGEKSISIERTMVAQSEDEFLDALEKIFRAEKTAQIITGLMVQASSVPIPEETSVRTRARWVRP